MRQDVPADTLLKLDQQLCFALYSASLAMTRLYKPLLQPLGLTYPQYLVLLVLWEQDGRAVHELGDLLQLDSGTLTPLLKRMAQAGWVTRERDTEDERRLRIRLTPAGKALRAQARDIPRTVVCRLDLGLPEVADLRDQLHALRQGLHPHSP